VPALRPQGAQRLPTSLSPQFAWFHLSSFHERTPSVPEDTPKLSIFTLHVKRLLPYNLALCERISMRMIQKALTFDDVLLLPAHSRVLPREVSLKTRLTRKLELNIPIVSAAMDMTEARRDRNRPGRRDRDRAQEPEPKAQAAEAQARASNRALRDPMTVTPDDGARRWRCRSSIASLIPGRQRWSSARHQPRIWYRDSARLSLQDIMTAAAPHHRQGGREPRRRDY
jgi:hypothetical protein